ncbi:hypothetical protein TrST_g12546 [Triparma strigata]|uniref:Uncharacterized protein n=2 Tax=Triparma TaxID=722752 RepID=A0A9W7B730_9STRA|nr:hypothetical protein TrST_g12546 [Triparma strigata]
MIFRTVLLLTLASAVLSFNLGTPAAPKIVKRSGNVLRPAAAVSPVLVGVFGVVEAANAVVEADGYEYGSVDAPIGIAWGVGILAILTSFLPLALKGGEEALDDMRENEKYSFGKGKDVLNGRGKKK